VSQSIGFVDRVGRNVSVAKGSFVKGMSGHVESYESLMYCSSENVYNNTYEKIGSLAVPSSLVRTHAKALFLFLITHNSSVAHNAIP